MPYHEAYFTTSDGIRLFQRRWLPDQDALAVVVVVHGFLEHSGRYADLAERLTSHGLAVYALDLRGHGKSDGPRAMVYSFDEYLRDVETLLQRAGEQQPGKPVFLFGHSMGGLIALWVAIRRQGELSGLITSGAAVRLGARAFPWLRRLAIVAGWLLPRVRLVRMGSGMLSRDPAVADDFRRDPLVFHGRFPLRTGAEIIRAGRALEPRLDELRLPLLILHGTGDVVTDPLGSREAHARARSSDKTLCLYEGLYHDVTHEPQREKVVADLVAWLDARISSQHTIPAQQRRPG